MNNALHTKIDPNILLEPNDFKLGKTENMFKENNMLWIKDFYYKLKEHAQNKNFSSFTQLVEDVFLFSHKESLAVGRLMDKMGLLNDDA